MTHLELANCAEGETRVVFRSWKIVFSDSHDTCLPSLGSELAFSGHVEAADGKTEFKNAFFVKN